MDGALYLEGPPIVTLGNFACMSMGKHSGLLLSAYVRRALEYLCIQVESAGLVHRMPCGRSVALKLAPLGSPEAQMLRTEATVYLVLQELWNKDVPELLLAGPMRAFRSGYALGTCLLPGRPLQKGAGLYSVAGAI